MKQLPIGLIIKEVSGEKNLKVAKLAELSGKTRQSIYFTFGRAEMSEEEIQEWAKILDVTRDYLFDRWKNNTQSATSGNDSNGYLLEHLIRLEEQFRIANEQLRDQLAMKDKQIDGLQRTVDVLLGKSEDVIKLMAARVIPLLPEMEERA